MNWSEVSVEHGVLVTDPEEVAPVAHVEQDEDLKQREFLEEHPRPHTLCIQLVMRWRGEDENEVFRNSVADFSIDCDCD